MGLKFTGEMEKHLSIILMHEIISVMVGSGITQGEAIKEICSSGILEQCIKDAQEPLPKNCDYEIRLVTTNGDYYGKLLDSYLQDNMDDTKAVAKTLTKLHLWQVAPTEEAYRTEHLLPLLINIVQNYLQPQGRDTPFLLYRLLSHLRADVMPKNLLADINGIEDNAISKGVVIIGGCLYSIVNGGNTLSLSNLKAITKYFEVLIEHKRRAYLRTIPEHFRPRYIDATEVLTDLLCIVNGRLAYRVLVDGEVHYLSSLTRPELIELLKINSDVES